MEIHPDLQRFIETPKKDEHEKVRKEFLRRCELFDMSLSHFDRTDENIEDKIDILTELHQRCYTLIYSPQESRDYVERCTYFTGYRAFMLTSSDGEVMAATWIDNGEPYPPDVELMREEYMRQTGSNLLVSTVQMMTHPGIRNEGIQQGLDRLIMDFCDQVFNAPVLFVRRIDLENSPSQKVAEKGGFAPIASVVDMRIGYGRFWASPPVDPYGLAAHVARLRKEEQRQRWETTHFPRYPARYLGSVAVVTSFAPHEGREKFFRKMKSFALGEKKATSFGYDNNELFESQNIDAADTITEIDHLNGANQTITLQNFSTIRCIIWWSNDQILRVEVRVPFAYVQDNEMQQALIGPNLDVVATEMSRLGYDKIKFAIKDVALKELNQLIDIHSVVSLGDVADIGNTDLTIDMQALHAETVRDQTIVSIDIKKLKERLGKLAWMKDQYTAQPDGVSVVGLTEPQNT